jgi:tetratricopeptide (TPR) repeat protein
MKTAFFSLLFCAISTSGLFAQTSDDQSIKNVINTETNSYFNLDTDGWQKCWEHTPEASHTFVTNGIYRRLKGWDNFGPAVISALKKLKKDDFDFKTSSDSFFIKSDGKMAFVTYNQKRTSKDPTLNENTFEKRVLLKENDGWKILFASTEAPESFDASKPKNMEDNMNTTGYNLINAKRINDAIEVFRLNVKLFPNSWNTYDSLGEALALSGDKAAAIENYEKSIALNPNNTNGKTALEKLKAK